MLANGVVREQARSCVPTYYGVPDMQVARDIVSLLTRHRSGVSQMFLVDNQLTISGALVPTAQETPRKKSVSSPARRMFR